MGKGKEARSFWCRATWQGQGQGQGLGQIDLPRASHRPSRSEMTDVLCLHTKLHRTSEPYNQKSALLSVEIKLCLSPLVMGSLLHQAQQTWELWPEVIAGP